MAQKQRDQKAPQSTVAIEVGVQRLELHVEQADAHERWKVALIVDRVLELAQQLSEPLRRFSFSFSTFSKQSPHNTYQ